MHNGLISAYVTDYMVYFQLVLVWISSYRSSTFMLVSFTYFYHLFNCSIIRIFFKSPHCFNLSVVPQEASGTEKCEGEVHGEKIVEKH